MDGLVYYHGSGCIIGVYIDMVLNHSRQHDLRYHCWKLFKQWNYDSPMIDALIISIPRYMRASWLRVLEGSLSPFQGFLCYYLMLEWVSEHGSKPHKGYSVCCGSRSYSKLSLGADHFTNRRHSMRTLVLAFLSWGSFSLPCDWHCCTPVLFILLRSYKAVFFISSTEWLPSIAEI